MTSRRQLTVAILSTELLLIAGAILATGFWFRRTVAESIASQALEDNLLFAQQIGQLIEELEIGDVSDVEGKDWKHLQHIIAGAQLPNDGYLCVVEGQSGRLICHPKIVQYPSLSELEPGKSLISTDGGGGRIVDEVSRAGMVVGRSQMGNDLVLLAAKRLEGLGANLLVHQSMNAVNVKATRTVRPIYWIGAIIGALLLAASGLGCSRLLGAYDLRLEKVNASLEQTVHQRTGALMKTRNAVILGLAKLSESRDTDTGDHLDRICFYSQALANRLRHAHPKVDDAFVETIGLASSLHDIGKVGIPDAVLLKPGRLDVQERSVVEQHPLIGCQTLLKIELELGEDNFLSMAREICLSHHEKWDGSGYPMGIAGDEIPLAARIVAVADVYDALTSERPYKSAMSHDEASETILQSAGTHFDPDVVLAFRDARDEFLSLCNDLHGRHDSNGPTELEDVEENRPAYLV